MFHRLIHFNYCCLIYIFHPRIFCNFKYKILSNSLDNFEPIMRHLAHEPIIHRNQLDWGRHNLSQTIHLTLKETHPQNLQRYPVLICQQNLNHNHNQITILLAFHYYQKHKMVHWDLNEQYFQQLSHKIHLNLAINNVTHFYVQILIIMQYFQIHSFSRIQQHDLSLLLSNFHHPKLILILYILSIAMVNIDYKDDSNRV